MYERERFIETLPSEAHGDGAGGDLSEPGGEDERGGRAGAGEPRGEGEGHGEAVGHSHDDVAHHLPSREVTLPVARALLQHRLLPRVTAAFHRRR
jgi:hypothetical protein